MESPALEAPQAQAVEPTGMEEKKRKREDSADESEIPDPKKAKLEESPEPQNASTAATDSSNTSQEKKPQQKRFIADGKKKSPPVPPDASEVSESIPFDTNILFSKKFVGLFRVFHAPKFLFVAHKRCTHLKQLFDSLQTFKFGNYIGYYGYRLNEKGQDPRIGVLKPEWFNGKDVLDIGCNSGVFTLQMGSHDICILPDDPAPPHSLTPPKCNNIACYFNVKKVEGRDIDSHLIDMAIKTRDRWYEEHFKLPEGQEKKDITKLVTFKTENFVAESLQKKPPAKAAAAPSPATAYTPAFASGLPSIKKQSTVTFDVVTCMSVTKWIHLNWGDEGILAAFKRFQQLVRVGGYLIIEIQDWNSYKKKKDMTETTADNFTKIKLRPTQFPDILAERFYFKFIEVLHPVNPVSRGFTRPISVFQRI